jgi:short-subunit dehydrogenase
MTQEHLFVVGVGPGIGTATAVRFAREGFDVTVLARSESTLDTAAAAVRAEGVTVSTAQADAARPEALKAVLADLAETSPPTVVLYNAAVIAFDNLLTIEPAALLEAWTIDLIGAITTAQAIVPSMRRSSSGTMLFTGGGFADHPRSDAATLSLGKLALRAAVDLIADEVRSDGVHVASLTVTDFVSPGTDFAPTLIADAYWAIHHEPPQRWSSEYLYDGTLSTRKRP